MGIRARIVASLIAAVLLANAALAELQAVSVKLNDPKLPATPGYHVIKATVKVGKETTQFACGIFLPPAYFKAKDSLPIVMTLHTRGNSGADGGGGLTGEGLGLLMASGGPDSRGTGEKPKNALSLPTGAEFIGLAPQCPAAHGWDQQPVPKILAEFVTQVARAGRGDEDRVYLTGFSYGGTSTWTIAMQVPERFAAIVPLDGRATGNPAGDVKKLKDVAIYLGVGGDDNDFLPESRRMRDALTAMRHPKFSFHIVPGGNHWCYGSVYTDPEFWKWLFAQRRDPRTAGKGPATRAAT